MEFLPSTSLPSNDSNNYPEGSVTGPRARVAFYLRPRDISNRYIADLRLVVATMNADVVPVSYIRGLCTVKHRDEIDNLERYKREKDCFYFHSVSNLKALQWYSETDESVCSCMIGICTVTLTPYPPIRSRMLLVRYFQPQLAHAVLMPLCDITANIVAHLTNNFEYIICEPSMSLELCDAQRGCLVCHKWAARCA